MTRRPKGETFSHGILTSCASDAGTQVGNTFNSIGIWNHASPVNHDFYLTTAVLKDLVMIPVHTKPEDSDIELDELYDVFINVKKKWKTDVRTRKITYYCRVVALRHLRDK